MSVALLDLFVFSKPYFDRFGLIVATRDDQPVGFVHAGFGPNEQGDQLDYDLGATCMLMVHPSEAGSPLAEELLARSEEYLRSKGARVLYGGGARPLNPFYLGLYGGSEMPGILASDHAKSDFFQQQGYSVAQRISILNNDLSCFRPVIDRRILQLRRTTQIQMSYDPKCDSWWHAITEGCMERVGIDLYDDPSQPKIVTSIFWSLEPLASSWGVRAAGLSELSVATERRHQGLATHLLNESFKQMQAQSVSLVEVQIMEDNETARQLYRKLGFIEVDQGIVLRKDV